MADIGTVPSPQAKLSKKGSFSGATALKDASDVMALIAYRRS
jgi:hypothetical protein